MALQLLDVQGAVESLPSMSVTSDPTENRQRMAAGAENLVAPLVAPTRDFSGVLQSTAVHNSAFSSERIGSPEMQQTAEKPAVSRQFAKSGWRDLNPRPLAPQADLKAISLLAIRHDSIRLRCHYVVGFLLSQVQSKCFVSSRFLSVSVLSFSSASVVVIVATVLGEMRSEA